MKVVDKLENKRKVIRKNEEIKVKENGITLIALVITIIVLLILAAVSIATLTGENGILTRATEAKKNTGIGKEKEILQLAYTSAIINNEPGEFKKNFDNELDNMIR